MKNVKGKDGKNYTLKPDSNLNGADLSGLDLSGVDIRGSDLIGANLRGANLKRANLRRTNLTKANLSDANLTRADLSESNLRKANLNRADLRKANLSNSIISGANLTGASFENANLRRTDLKGVNLKGVNLKGADLEGAATENTKGENIMLRDMDRNLRKYHSVGENYTQFFVSFSSSGPEEVSETSNHTVSVLARNTSDAAGLARTLADRMGQTNIKILRIGKDVSKEVPNEDKSIDETVKADSITEKDEVVNSLTEETSDTSSNRKFSAVEAVKEASKKDSNRKSFAGLVY